MTGPLVRAAQMPSCHKAEGSVLTALPGASAPQGACGEDGKWVEQGEGPCSDWSDDHEERLRAEEQRAGEER